MVTNPKRVGEEDEPRLDGEEGGDELEKKMNRSVFWVCGVSFV